MREPPGPVWGRAASCCLLPHGCSGRRRARPPARSPHASLTARSGRSRGPPWPRRRPPAPRPGPTGTAARPRRPRGGLQSVGARCPCVARPCPPVPPAPSTPAGPGVLVCCSSFRSFACNSPPALCWFVSVCNVTPLVFVNCMRRLLSAGPAVAHRHRGWAVLTFPVLQADQTSCVRG